MPDLLRGRDLYVEWKPELLDEPFFVACGPKGLTFNYDAPMTDVASRLFLRKTCEEVGLGGVESNSTTYVFRRGTATTMQTVYGDAHTKDAMHHDQASNTLNKNYSNAVMQTDLVPGILDHQKKFVRGRNELDAAYLHRPLHTPTFTVLSVEDATEIDDQLADLADQREVWQNHLMHDSDWMRDALNLTADDRSLIEMVQDGDDIVSIIYQRITKRFKRRLATVRGHHRAEELREYAKQPRNLTLDILQARQQEIQAPSNFMARLAAPRYHATSTDALDDDGDAYERADFDDGDDDAIACPQWKASGDVRDVERESAMSLCGRL
ncbi:hypothetical protein JAAARDRAFT_194336 [Jaapia argillacea MUCL 33604]|uniref:Uncharacterized protein n=1 Tax=Jaapia argillacea MUCL 33604 TaxID=933084 RepID=A0A067Q3J1_9AGAM|nr:hypothetical protein JAAARDRAFT_194336 [Jaapia argillacea MUCL 33604]